MCTSTILSPRKQITMSQTDRVKINKLPTGVPGLDEILGGGIPELSFNLIAGAPGSGKTTLAHQFVFANATSVSPGLSCSTLCPSTPLFRSRAAGRGWDDEPH